MGLVAYHLKLVIGLLSVSSALNLIHIVLFGSEYRSSPRSREHNAGNS